MDLCPQFTDYDSAMRDYLPAGVSKENGGDMASAGGQI